MSAGCCVRLSSAAIAACCLLIGSTPLWADGYGTLTGQFVFDGALPKPSPLVRQGDKSARDPDVCAKHDVPDESLLVDPKTKGVANVFVFMSKAPADIHPDLKTSKDKVVKFDQKDCRFRPHAMVLRTDQTVAVLSDDPIPHNTHVNTLLNRGENMTIQAGDREGTTRWNFPAQERFVTMINCDIHGWMKAWWLIVDHPYAAITDAQGNFKIEKIPAGTHQFLAWHEKGGWLYGKTRIERVRAYNIPAGGTTSIGVIKLKPTLFQGP